MYIEVVGAGDCAIWFDISLDLTMTGILIDAGSVYGGLFVSVVDVVNLMCL